MGELVFGRWDGRFTTEEIGFSGRPTGDNHFLSNGTETETSKIVWNFSDGHTLTLRNELSVDISLNVLILTSSGHHAKLSS